MINGSPHPRGCTYTALHEMERVLRAAGQVENGVLRRAVGDQYRAVADGLYRMAQSWQPQTALPQLESRVCALLNALQLQVRQLSAVRLADGSPQVELVLRPVRLGDDGLEELTREIGRCCGQPMIGLCTQTQAEGAAVQTLRFLPRPVCTARVGVASRALSGGVCGDVVEQLPQDTGLCVLLCDGMGTGPAAAMDAKMTARFTARLLRAGFRLGFCFFRVLFLRLLFRLSGSAHRRHGVFVHLTLNLLKVFFHALALIGKRIHIIFAAAHCLAHHSAQFRQPCRAKDEQCQHKDQDHFAASDSHHKLCSSFLSDSS